MFLFLTILGCPDTSTDSGKPDTDTADLGDVVVTATDVPSVWRVTWTTPTATDGVVYYSTDGSDDHSVVSTDSSDGLSHEVLLAGLAESLTWVGHAQSSDGSWRSEEFSIDNGSAPGTLPGVTLSADSDTTLSGFVIVPTTSDETPNVSIYDRMGRRVWWVEGDLGDIISQAWLSNDGTQVWWLSMTETNPGLRRIDLDGSNYVEIPRPNLHHDFIQLPDDTLVTIEYDGREMDGVMVDGDRLMHLDADGNEIEELFNTWDHYSPTIPGDVGEYYDWSHANSVSFEEASNTLVVSFYGWSSILGIDYDSGDIEFAMGGEKGDFGFTPGSDHFSRQHSPTLAGDTMTVFNNKDINEPSENRWSEGIEYQIDWETKSLDQIWSYTADQEVFVAVMGNVDRIDVDHHLVGFGSAGRVVETNGEDAVWQIDADLGGPMGFSHYLPSLAGASH